jgi:hypothetical protein
MGKELIKKRFGLLAPLLNERQLRLYVAAEARWFLVVEASP